MVRLTKGLVKQGHQIAIITSNIKGCIIKNPTIPSCNLYAVLSHGRYTSAIHGGEFLIRSTLKMIKKHKEERFDIIHIHSAYPIFGLISNISPLINHIPFVYTLYSPIRLKPLRDRKGIYQSISSSKLSKLYLHSIDVIIAVSGNVRRSLDLMGSNNSNIELVPPAVDDEFFDCGSSPFESRNSARANLGLDKDIPVILYCGNWAPWKGVDVLIDSMAMIVSNFPQAKLITAWNETYNWYDERKLEIARKIKNLGLENNVIEMGVVENIWEIMAACDVLAVPFLNTDGVADHPLVILEAMACGKPVVATKVGGIPEVIQNGVNGLLVMAGDECELANAICSLLADRKLANEISRNARRYAVENCTVDYLAQRHEKIYEKVLYNRI